MRSGSMLKHLIKWGRVTGERDSKAMPLNQVSYLGKSSDAVQWMPYGFDASPPLNTLTVVLGVFGLDCKIHLPGSPGKGPTLKPSGEVVVYNPETGSHIHFREDGTIYIKGTTVTIDAKLIVTGDTELGAVVNSGGTNIGKTHAHGAGSYLDSLSGSVSGTSGTPI